MVGRVAVLSDVHGVLPALRAVLEEPEVREADRIVVTGDIAAGPMPVETLDLLAAQGERVTLVGGNADRELCEYRRSGRTAIPDPIAPWAAEQLRDDQLDLLDSLPKSVTLDLPHQGPTLFCHATPRDDEEVVLVDSSLGRWDEVLGGLDAAVRTVVCGHTHMPFARLAHGRMVVNPGSVGMPYGRAGAHWALLGKGVELRVADYDREAAKAELARKSGYGSIEEWADYFVDAAATDAEAIRVFGPRDGRRG